MLLELTKQSLSCWVVSPTVWQRSLWQMTNLFMWTAASHYGSLLPGRHVLLCVTFPRTFIKCLMGKNRGQATLVSRLVLFGQPVSDCRWRKDGRDIIVHEILFVCLACAVHQLLCRQLIRRVPLNSMQEMWPKSNEKLFFG